MSVLPRMIKNSSLGDDWMEIDNQIFLSFTLKLSDNILSFIVEYKPYNWIKHGCNFDQYSESHSIVITEAGDVTIKIPSLLFVEGTSFLVWEYAMEWCRSYYTFFIESPSLVWSRWFMIHHYFQLYIRGTIYVFLFQVKFYIKQTIFTLYKAASIWLKFQLQMDDRHDAKRY